MGLTYVEIVVENPSEADLSEQIELVVDSGAVYSVVPATTLEELRITPKGEQEFRLANGMKIVRKKGVAHYRYGERFGGADAIFGEDGGSTLLGATTLEALGLV